MSWEESESKHKPCIFFLCFLFLLSNLFTGFVFTGFSSGVWPLFGAHHKMGARNLLSVFTYSSVVLNSLSLPQHSSSHLPQNELFPYFRLVSEGGPYLFLVVPDQHRSFGTSFFFKSFLINFFTNPWLADKLVPGSFRAPLPVPVDSMSDFFFFFFPLFLPRKLASRSLYNLDLPYHVTIVADLIVCDIESQLL